MEIKYNITGKDRKALVVSIAEIIDTAISYKGAPSFAYEIGAYTVSRNGTLSFADGTDAEALLRALDERGYTPEQPSTKLTVEIPKERLTETGLQNLDRLIASKGNLIRKAIGAESLAYEVRDDIITFPWFTMTGDSGEGLAYSQLVAALVEMASAAKRITAQPAEYDNEKYAFRCFLLRLGFIGDEYKASRKILLRNLTGSSAFKSGNPKVQEMVEHINGDAGLYDDVMSLQDEDAADNE